MKFDREIFFDSIRASLYGGSIRDQKTVDGINHKLDYFEKLGDIDLRWLANALGQFHHETGARMYPVRETFASSDAEARARLGGAVYAQPDPVTGHSYYGRGDIQLTWADNYKKQEEKHQLDLYRTPDLMLDSEVSVVVSYHGMEDGDYRADAIGKQSLLRYFNSAVDDPFDAREIVNGDKHRKPSWAGGRSIGQLCVKYHNAYLDALELSLTDEPEPPVVEPPVDPEAPCPSHIMEAFKEKGCQEIREIDEGQITLTYIYHRPEGL